jgi:predicted nucleic acid-binding protein
VSFLLDTNVVSEPTKPRPNHGLLAWLTSVDEESVFISTITISELRYGIERLPAGVRKTRLDTWLRNDLLSRFEGRTLPVNIEVADACGRLSARADFLGRSIEARDAFIAATAEVHGLTLVTRNVSDFSDVLKSILSPWT